MNNFYLLDRTLVLGPFLCLLSTIYKDCRYIVISRDLKLWENVYHPLCFMSHIPIVMCPMSHYTFKRYIWKKILRYFYFLTNIQTSQLIEATGLGAWWSKDIGGIHIMNFTPVPYHKKFQRYKILGSGFFLFFSKNKEDFYFLFHFAPLVLWPPQCPIATCCWSIKVNGLSLKPF